MMNTNNKKQKKIQDEEEIQVEELEYEMVGNVKCPIDPAKRNECESCQ